MAPNSIYGFTEPLYGSGVLYGATTTTHATKNYTLGSAVFEQMIISAPFNWNQLSEALIVNGRDKIIASVQEREVVSSVQEREVVSSYRDGSPVTLYPDQMSSADQFGADQSSMDGVFTTDQMPGFNQFEEFNKEDY
jgi:hypothetical protein